MSIAVDCARIALLGCGNVGGALARLAQASPAHHRPLAVCAALVRNAGRPRDGCDPLALTTDPVRVLSSHPDVVVELLGGVEPARTLVLEALYARTPVVTANKTLMARHGVELRQASRATNTPLLYEAAVIAGVPFLGTFARRPYAASATRLTAIANGTSNFVLTACAQGSDLSQAIAIAQRRGYAEPDPRSDVDGIDAAEKLALLLQHFAGLAVDPDAIETVSLLEVRSGHLVHARSLGGVIKPVIVGEWGADVRLFSGPAFVPGTHALATVDGVENALWLGTPRGRLFFQGPGAGPEVTAATVLDDVCEVLEGGGIVPAQPLRTAEPREAETGWLVLLEGRSLPRPVDVADFLGAHGVHIRNTSVTGAADVASRAYLTWPAPRVSVETALSRLSAATDCETSCLRALEDQR